MKFYKIQNEIYKHKSDLIKPKVNVTNTKTKKISLKIAIKQNISKPKWNWLNQAEILQNPKWNITKPRITLTKSRMDRQNLE